MKEVFIKYFIPHESNDHKPHLLRPQNALFIVLAIAVIQLSFFVDRFVIIQRTNLLGDIIANVLVDETNVQRKDFSLGTLASNATLQAGAQLKANDMAAKGYFAHVSPDGTTPWHWFQEAGYNFEAAGENLAVNFTDSQDVVNAWMNSPTHRENMLNNNYTQIGIATAKGMYQGHEAIFVVQFFGRPVPAEAALTESTPPPAPIETTSASAPKPTPITVKNPPPPVLQSRVEVVTSAPTATANPQNNVVAAQDLATTSREVLGTANTAPDSQPAAPVTTRPASVISRILANPQDATSSALALIGLIVLVALCLKIFVKMHIQHPHLIVNGMAIIVFVLVLLSANQHLATMGAQIF